MFLLLWVDCFWYLYGQCCLTNGQTKLMDPIQMSKPTKCFECDSGSYKEVTINYFSQLSEGRSCVTRNVTIQRCDTCGSDILDSNASEVIEANIERNYPGYYDKWKNKAKTRL